MRRLGVVVLVVCAIALLALVLRGGQPVSRTGEPARPRGVPMARAPAVGEAAFTAWLGQPRLAARRVAGRVTFEGQPVGDAVVRITSA